MHWTNVRQLRTSLSRWRSPSFSCNLSSASRRSGTPQIRLGSQRRLKNFSPRSALILSYRLVMHTKWVSGSFDELIILISFYDLTSEQSRRWRLFQVRRNIPQLRRSSRWTDQLAPEQNLHSCSPSRYPDCGWRYWATDCYTRSSHTMDRSLSRIFKVTGTARLSTDVSWERCEGSRKSNNYWKCCFKTKSREDGKLDKIRSFLACFKPVIHLWHIFETFDANHIYLVWRANLSLWPSPPILRNQHTVVLTPCCLPSDFSLWSSIPCRIEKISRWRTWYAQASTNVGWTRIKTSSLLQSSWIPPTRWNHSNQVFISQKIIFFCSCTGYMPVFSRKIRVLVCEPSFTIIWGVRSNTPVYTYWMISSCVRQMEQYVYDMF